MAPVFLVHHEPSSNWRDKTFVATQSTELANFMFETLSLIARDDDIVVLVRDPYAAGQVVLRVARMTRHGRLFVDPELPLPPWVEIGTV